MAAGTKTRASRNGSTQKARKAPTAAEKARRTRQSAKAKAAKPEADRLEVEWAKILEHEQAINQEYQGLLQQQQAIQQEIDRVQKLANQIVGRKDLLMELRDEKEPIPTVREMMEARAAQMPAAAGAPQPEETDDEEPKED